MTLYLEFNPHKTRNVKVTVCGFSDSYMLKQFLNDKVVHGDMGLSLLLLIVSLKSLLILFDTGLIIRHTFLVFSISIFSIFKTFIANNCPIKAGATASWFIFYNDIRLAQSHLFLCWPHPSPSSAMAQSQTSVDEGGMYRELAGRLHADGAKCDKITVAVASTCTTMAVPAVMQQQVEGGV